MLSVRVKIVLLFLLVTLPAVAAYVSQQRLVDFALSSLRVKETRYLDTLEYLLSLERLVARPRLVTSRGAPDVTEPTSDTYLQEVAAARAHVGALAVDNAEWLPVTQELDSLIQLLSDKRKLTSAALTQRQVAVSAEISNLLVRFKLKAGNGDSAVDHLSSANQTTAWILVIAACTAAVWTWLAAGRYSSQLALLRRWVHSLARGEPVMTRYTRTGNDELSAVLEAFDALQQRITHSMVNREYFEDLLHSMSESVVVSDLVGQIVYANAAASRLLDPSNQGMIGKDLATFITFPWNMSDHSGSAWYDGPLSQYEERCPHVFARRTHLSNKSGSLQGTVYVIQDVSQSKELVRANMEYREQLSRSERLASFGTLGAIVAHKFNQPLSTVRLFLQQIQRELHDKSVSAVVRENLTESLAELGRIAEITKQMVATGKRQAVSGAEGERAHVLPAVQRVIDSLQLSATRKNVTLHNLCSESSCAVSCADFELEELLYCLINNSIQAAPDNRPTQVTVSVEDDGDFVKLLVCDTGRGISTDHLDRVFDWCFTTKPEGQGTGLGLAIVRSIVEQHGGRISVMSEERIGSRFSILLPRAKEEQNGNVAECIHCG